MFKVKSTVVLGFMILLAACTVWGLTGCASPPTDEPVIPSDQPPMYASPITWTVHATSPEGSNTPPPTPTLASCIVTTGLEDGTVYLRRCPMCEVIGYVTEGDELDLSPTQPDSYWYQVIGRNGAMAWIARRFCLEVKP